MEIVNFQKEGGEAVGLRLVADKKDAPQERAFEKQFISYQFLCANTRWRRLDPAHKLELKEEFMCVFDSFRESMLLFCYSLVGFDPKADLMFWRIGNSLDAVQEMTVALNRTGLGSYLDTADNYLSATKNMMFVDGPSTKRFHVAAGEKKYHFLYPCSKNRDWYDKSSEERSAMIEEHFMVGKRFSNIGIHLTHAFGFSDQEYIISFETDEPRDFLALAEELMHTPASKFTERGMPIYTCRQRTLAECLDSLG